MKRNPLISSLTAALVAGILPLTAQTILIDHNDGDAGNGICDHHDAVDAGRQCRDQCV